MATVGQDQIFVARILNEDDQFLTLEVCKDPERQLRIESGDKFLTMLFIHQTDDGETEAWKPWEA